MTVHKYIAEFMDTVITELDQQLQSTEFLTGRQMSMMDIIIYCELMTIVKLYYLRFEEGQYVHFSEWQKTIEANKVIKALNLKLEQVIERECIAIRTEIEEIK